jgi:hypothetical protein
MIDAPAPICSIYVLIYRRVKANLNLWKNRLMILEFSGAPLDNSTARQMTQKAFCSRHLTSAQGLWRCCLNNASLL